MVIRTRFAPSPTGFLHVGSIRTALFNYLFAKKYGGQFILRLEDTDRERFVAEGVEQIVEGLNWVGLRPDDGFWISEGQHQHLEYVQSERHKLGIYQMYADELVAKGLAYYSPTAPHELDKMREQAAKDKRPFIYRKNLDIHNTTKKSTGVPIRLDIEAVKQSTNSVEWVDEVRGKFKEDVRLIEDFILIKSDNFPTYNFANVIDDHQMLITHAIRGDEFISSTAKHVLLYKLLEWEPPKFVHLPVINGTDGKKLSKRTGNTNVLDYRDKGYLPEALLNFLALLGWNDGTEQEIFSLDELANKFSVEQINRSPAIFDQRRLDWINGYYIRQMTLDTLYEHSNNFWPAEAKDAPEAYKKAVLGLVQERLKYLGELPVLTRFFFVDLAPDQKLITEHKQLGQMKKSELKHLLTQAEDSLQDSNFSTEDLAKRLNDLLQITNQKPAVLFSLIRIATSWASASPELASTLSVLGKERVLQRIKKTRSLL